MRTNDTVATIMLLRFTVPPAFIFMIIIKMHDSTMPMRGPLLKVLAAADTKSTHARPYEMRCICLFFWNRNVIVKGRASPTSAESMTGCPMVDDVLPFNDTHGRGSILQNWARAYNATGINETIKRLMILSIRF